MSTIRNRPTQNRILLSAFVIAVIGSIIIIISSPFSGNNPNTRATLTLSTASGTVPVTDTSSGLITSSLTNTPRTPQILPTARNGEGTSTPVNVPTAFDGALGINTPEGFEVVYWYTDYMQCDKNPRHTTYNVYGLIFSPGTPSYLYRFTFWRLDKVKTPFGYTATPTFTPQPSPTATPTVFPLFLTPDLITPTPTSDSSVSALGESVLFDQSVVLLKDRYYHVTISFEWENGTASWIDDLFYPGTKNDPRCAKP